MTFFFGIDKKNSMNNCAPNIGDSTSCFTLEELQAIATSYNASSKGKKIKIPNGDSAKSKGLLRKRIADRLSKDECSWVDSPYVQHIQSTELRTKLEQFTCKPKPPRGRKQWLTTFDINNVLVQYERAYSHFTYMGALPCDFYKYISLKQMDFTTPGLYGFVLNIDTRGQKGSHWVALCIDTFHKTCEYFDSVGNAPNRCIRACIVHLFEHYIQGYTYLENNIVHQRQNSECGVYSIYYLVQRIHGSMFYDIVHTIVSDKDMNEFRAVVFRRG